MLRLNKIFSSTRLSQSKKFKLYKTLITPVVAYSSETWTLNRLVMKLVVPSSIPGGGSIWPVSYTHLDVYKRQVVIVIVYFEHSDMKSLLKNLHIKKII